MSSKELLGAVLELSTKERALIAHELLLSLDEQRGEAPDERELLDELDRRRRQAESGEVQMLDRAEFEQAIARRRAARRSP